MTKKRTADDWFARAAPAVLELGDKELSGLAIPVGGLPTGPEELTLQRLALLEHCRREAVADPQREAEIEREGGLGYRSLLAFHAGSDDDHDRRSAALVRKRPQPRKVKLGPWVPPWMRP